GVGRHLALVEDDVLAGIDAGGEVAGRHLARLLAQRLGILPDRDRVLIDDAIDAVELVLQAHPIADGAEIVAEMEVLGGLDAREDAVLRRAHGRCGPLWCGGTRGLGIPRRTGSYRDVGHGGQAAGWRRRRSARNSAALVPPVSSASTPNTSRPASTSRTTAPTSNSGRPASHHSNGPEARAATAKPMRRLLMRMRGRRVRRRASSTRWPRLCRVQLSMAMLSQDAMMVPKAMPAKAI